MGCYESRIGMTEEEFCIIINQRFLGYAHHTARQIEFCFKRFSRNGRLNSTQFSEACKHLQINVAGLSTPDSSIAKVYAKLKSGEDYLCQKLVAMGLLLGTGELEDKVTLLFEHCDDDFTGKIQAATFRSLLNDIISVSIEALPLCSVGKGENMCSQDEMTTYVTTLSKAKNSASDAIMKKLFGTAQEVTKEEFINAAKTGEAVSLLSSHGVRKFLVETHKKQGDPSLNIGKDALRKAFNISMGNSPAKPAAPAATTATQAAAGPLGGKAEPGGYVPDNI